MKTQYNLNIGGLFGTVIWVALGLLVYLWLGAPVFSWFDPWLYVYMVFWPVPLVWHLFLWFLAIVCVVLGVLGIMWCWDKLT